MQFYKFSVVVMFILVIKSMKSFGANIDKFKNTEKPISSKNLINQIPVRFKIDNLLDTMNKNFNEWINKAPKNLTKASFAPEIGTEFISIQTNGNQCNHNLEKFKTSLDNFKTNRARRLVEDRMTTYQQNCSAYTALNLHNYYRTLHANTSNLTLNSVLNQVAQNYSYQLAYVINNSSQYNLVHSNNPRLGENLFLYCQYGIISNATLMSKLKKHIIFQ
jgi:hypothetical protein